jgi:hypothetical protein
LYERALAAFERTSQSVPDRAAAQCDALDAIVFAAFALEGFLNELPVAITLRVSPPIKTPADARLPKYDTTADKCWAHYASRLMAEEEAQASVSKKLELTCELLHGRADKGSTVYQDAALLLDARDALAHVRLDHVVFDESGGAGRREPRAATLLTRLRSKGILADPESVAPEDPRARWMKAVGNEFVLGYVQMLCTRAAARWACDSTAGIVRHIFHTAPKSHLALEGEQMVRRFVPTEERAARKPAVT